MGVLPAVPESKALGVIFLGVVLYIGSAYVSTMLDDVGTAGVVLGSALVVLGMSAQIINWWLYFSKKLKDRADAAGRVRPSGD